MNLLVVVINITEIQYVFIDRARLLSSLRYLSTILKSNQKFMFVHQN